MKITAENKEEENYLFLFQKACEFLGDDPDTVLRKLIDHHITTAEFTLYDQVPFSGLMASQRDVEQAEL